MVVDDRRNVTSECSMSTSDYVVVGRTATVRCRKEREGECVGGSLGGVLTKFGDRRLISREGWARIGHGPVGLG